MFVVVVVERSQVARPGRVPPYTMTRRAFPICMLSPGLGPLGSSLRGADPRREPERLRSARLRDEASRAISNFISPVLDNIDLHLTIDNRQYISLRFTRHWWEASPVRYALQ